MFYSYVVLIVMKLQYRIHSLNFFFFGVHLYNDSYCMRKLHVLDFFAVLLLTNMKAKNKVCAMMLTIVSMLETKIKFSTKVLYRRHG